LEQLGYTAGYTKRLFGGTTYDFLAKGQRAKDPGLHRRGLKGLGRAFSGLGTLALRRNHGVFLGLSCETYQTWRISSI